MKFQEKKTINLVLESLFESYSKRVPDVTKITEAMVSNNIVSNQSEIINDHIAFRTMGVKHLGIKSFEKIFLKHGYKKRDFYSFKEKKLNAYWYSHSKKNMPRIFISELKVDELSKDAQKIIKQYTNQVKNDPVDNIDLNNSDEIINFLTNPLWTLPSLFHYNELLKETEYGSWVIYNRYYLNHYTISVHELKEKYNTLEDFNKFLNSIGVKLNDSGGVIKESKDGFLLQSSSVANKVNAHFKEGMSLISGSYVEFAERKILPEFMNLDLNKINSTHRRDGFETSNADKIFESTYQKQVNK
ncbi:DUF1338 domain-containing protein [Flavobacteriaceae bacterium]|jgi:hypothetical protein|nr:DUF1338 domain-containing protein [Flavobacteriaceae bacterium]MDA9126902.1 DUF1338 domain-containing protein [Flavobacteriaceae bacterium]MDB4148590.1 DUF1338 domain-containing protein [Flavobacteriaceae bacterium]MDC0007892.1 DUF1338 domain-containing protein [Flavobacteriaceae bacterium]|tara:strand:+ start:4792 stop:5694 length:903 start_codon:yes stop_codon:yes gene_type:complete